MLITRVVVAIISANLMILGAGGASGQNYPNRPIRIVAGGVGGGNDYIARLMLPGLSANLGQPLIVDNRANGQDVVAIATPDGYTVLVTGSTLWRAPLIQKVPYDPVRDFAPIAMVGRSPQLLIVHPSLPVKSVKELIALAKARPGELNWATGSLGGTGHLTMELFRSMAGINVVHIPYKGGTAALTDLLAGRVQVETESPNAVMDQVKLGKLRALAVGSTEPSPLVPGVPTIAAALPGFESVTINAIFVPAKTPEAIIKRLNQEIVRGLNQAEVKEKLFNAGIETVSSSPEELAAVMKSDMARMSKVIKDAGIRTN